MAPTGTSWGPTSPPTCGVAGFFAVEHATHSAGCAEQKHVTASHQRYLQLDHSPQDVRVVEVFAGTGAINRACAERGLRSTAIDLSYSTSMNILQSGGFLSGSQSCKVYARLTVVACKQCVNVPRTCVRQILKMSPPALLWLAPVCSSWIFLSRASTKRSPACPEGDASLTVVRHGNIMLSRVVLLVRLAQGLGHRWCVEQPTSSLMNRMPRLQEVFAQYEVPVAVGFL